LLSCAVTPTSWKVAESVGRTYLRCELEGSPDATPLLEEAGAARVDVPPLVVLEIVPVAGIGLAALGEALGGRGRPLGIVSCTRAASSLIVELNERVSSLDLVVALTDSELRGNARRIAPLLPLEDEVLARFAGARLGAPELDAASMIETYTEPLLRE
jgi:hypothetical protein